MPTHASFYRAVKDAGGPLAPSSEPPPLDKLSEMALSAATRTRDSINQRSNILFPLGNVEVALVDNAAFNAFAHHDDGQEGIAVFAGLFYMLCDLSFAMWSHPTFLRTTHPLTESSISLASIRQRASALRGSRTWTGLMVVVPKQDRQRVFRAINTAMTAFLFVVFHETGHLVRAHIPYMGELSGSNVNLLLENSENIPLVGNDVFRLLEIDADIYAAKAVADCALTTWNMGRLFPFNYPLDRGTLEDYVADVAMGLSLAFFCMDLGSRNLDLLPESSHPSPGVRLYIAYLAMMDLLWKPFKIPSQESLALALKGFTEVREFWSKLRLPMGTINNNPMRMAELANSEYTDCHKFESRLRSVMDKRLRRFGTPCAHYEQFASFYD